RAGSRTRQRVRGAVLFAPPHREAGGPIALSTFQQYPTDRSREVVHDGVGRRIRRALVCFLPGAAPGTDENALCANCTRDADVQPLVADHERSRRIEAEVASGAVNKAASGLPAIARLRMRRDRAPGMVRTIV